MTDPLDDLESLTEKVIGCAIAVHRTLGPGLLESVYRECMLIELVAENLLAECERRVSLQYRGQRLATDLKLDLLVEGCLIVELKAVEHIHPIHLAQVITYLKLTGYPAGLLMNFNSMSLRAGLKRLDHPDLYVKKASAKGAQVGNSQTTAEETAARLPHNPLSVDRSAGSVGSSDRRPEVE